MSLSMLQGFLLGFSLIFAIGAQNIFVFRQGLLGRFIFPVVLFCSLSDTFLIFLGIFGLSFFVIEDIIWLKPYLLFFASLWLFLYGGLRFKSAFTNNDSLVFEQNDRAKLWSTMSVIFILSFGNPHVYLDTVILVGTVSLQYDGLQQVLFGLGASFASFIFFFGLGYGSKLLMPVMKKPNAWKIFDFGVGIVMTFLALLLFLSSGILKY
ncbi:MAG: LysE family transporter [Paracoccaceae bacterium]|nr:LysE family transporter [Paracoccaceae bacterium]